MSDTQISKVIGTFFCFSPLYHISPMKKQLNAINYASTLSRTCEQDLFVEKYYYFVRSQSTDKPFPSAVRGCAEFGSLDSSRRRRMFDYHTCSVMQMVGLIFRVFSLIKINITAGQGHFR